MGMCGMGAVTRGVSVRTPSHQAHVRISRDHINVIRFHFDAVGGFHHAHLGLALQQFRQKADVLGIQMLDENERHAGVGWQRLQQFRKCFQASGRGANSHDGENTVWRFVGLLRHERQQDGFGGAAALAVFRVFLAGGLIFFNDLFLCHGNLRYRYHPAKVYLLRVDGQGERASWPSLVARSAGK